MPEEFKHLAQFKAEAFLDDFVEALEQRFGKQIDFILLFGSAARGEFVIGKSDIDLVIQVKSDSVKKELEEFAEKAFWELDKRHGLSLKKVCSTGIGSGLLENALKFAERQARLYKPFEVFGPNDVEWSKGRVKRIDLVPGATLVASQLTLFYKMKHEGKILFGRDVRPEINPKFSSWEKLKSIWVPQAICVVAVVIAPLLPKKAVAYASKAVFYEVDAINFFLKGGLPEKGKKLEEFASSTEFRNGLLDSVRFYLELKFKLLPEQKRDFVRQALEVRRNGFKGGRLAAMRFVGKAFAVIHSVNAGAVLKKVLGGKPSESVPRRKRRNKAAK